MARDFDGSNDVINFGSGSTVDDLDPVTMAIWLYFDVITTGSWTPIVGKTNSGYSSGYTDYFNITSTGGEVYSARQRATTQAISISSTGAISAGSWQHCCSRWTLDETPEMFVDGSEVSYASEDAGSGSFQSNASYDLILGDVGSGQDYNGRAAEFALWDVQLSDAEITTLSLGFSPLFVRPFSLVFYAPLMGRQSPEIDIINANNGTVTGAANIAHPPMIWPHNKISVVPAAAPPVTDAGHLLPLMGVA